MDGVPIPSFVLPPSFYFVVAATAAAVAAFSLSRGRMEAGAAYPLSSGVRVGRVGLSLFFAVALFVPMRPDAVKYGCGY